ncbi:MAG: lysostaphin resistance A-like protein [Nitrospiraceae bacterium]
MDQPASNGGASLLPPHEEGVPGGAALRPPRFSPVLTILSAFILISAFALFGVLQFTLPRLERIASPERALALMVGRMMDLEEALRQAPAWERLLYDLTSGGSLDEQALAIAWYEELAASSLDPVVHLHLAILEAEAGRLDQVRRRADDWEGRRNAFPIFARLIRAGYLEPRLDRAVEQDLQANLAETLPSDWFYDRLAISLATRAGDRALVSSVGETLAARGMLLLGRTRTFAAIEMALFVAGAVGLVVIVARRRDPRALSIGTSQVPPPWRGRTAAAVLVRGGAMGAVLTLSLQFVEADNLLLRTLAIPLINLPLLILAYRHLLKPTGVGFGQWLGLRPSPTRWGRLAVVVPAVLAAGVVGEWVLGLVADSLHLSSHWTEWFDEDLVWGTLPVLGTSIVEYVVMAPVFEEMVFRGLLFATLRRKFGWTASALVSTAVFASAHGYGALGFASVFWTGVLWAWAYEKTGSLLPGMVAHSINNLVVCLADIVFLRV